MGKSGTGEWLGPCQPKPPPKPQGKQAPGLLTFATQFGHQNNRDSTNHRKKASVFAPTSR